MVVEVKYVVICEGEEKMLFISKKEVDVWDKMFDIVDFFDIWFEQLLVVLEDGQCEVLLLWLVEYKEVLSIIFKIGKLFFLQVVEKDVVSKMKK